MHTWMEWHLVVRAALAISIPLLAIAITPLVQALLLLDMADWLCVNGRAGHILAFDVPRELPGSSEVRCTMSIIVDLKARLVSC